MKITLKNLDRATKQQVADQVIGHLLTQGRASKDCGDMCVYRNRNGLSCAAGALMSDAEYKPEWDGEDDVTWLSLVSMGEVPKKNKYFISKLQEIHDKIEPDCWESALKLLCKEKKLRFNPPDV